MADEHKQAIQAPIALHRRAPELDHLRPALQRDALDRLHVRLRVLELAIRHCDAAAGADGAASEEPRRQLRVHRIADVVLVNI